MTILFLIISIIVLFYVCYYTFYAIKRCILRTLAVDVIVTLNKYNVDYWVDFGTLLGIIREQDIIFGDNDVDVVLVQRYIYLTVPFIVLIHWKTNQNRTV